MNFVFKRYVKDMLFLAFVPADTHYLHPYTTTYIYVFHTQMNFLKLDVGFDIQYHVHLATNI